MVLATTRLIVFSSRFGGRRQMLPSDRAMIFLLMVKSLASLRKVQYSSSVLVILN